MNALTASLIVALIGATAFVVVAVITSRARIGRLPAIASPDSSNTARIAIGLPEKARHIHAHSIGRNHRKRVITLTEGEVTRPLNRKITRLERRIRGLASPIEIDLTLRPDERGITR
jgi:hypothetical protein